MKKRVISILMVGALAMGLVTGCGSRGNTQDSQGSSKGSSGEKVTLSVLAGQSTTDAGIEEFIDAALEKKYPEIKLEWECVDWGNDFQPKMQQYMQSGLPDIMIGKAQDVSTYAPKGVLGEIDEKYLDRGLDAARENVTVTEKHTALYTMQCIRVYITTNKCLKTMDGVFRKHRKIFRKLLMIVRQRELHHLQAIW